MEKYRFREARSDDLASLVEMLADDELGKTRESTGTLLKVGHIRAFEAIQNDPNNELVVCESDGQLLGMPQMTFTPYLTYIGSWRALIEGVRVASSKRGDRIGAKLFEWTIQRAKEKAA